MTQTAEWWKVSLGKKWWSWWSDELLTESKAWHLTCECGAIKQISTWPAWLVRNLGVKKV